METENRLDDIDRRLLNVLLENSRAPLKELAERVGLSSPSVAERLRRLEERGVVRAFTVDIDPRALGFSLQAIVRVRPVAGKLHIVQKLIGDIPECIECDKVTGEDCFNVRLVLKSIEQLDTILDSLSDKAETNTAVIKAGVVPRRPAPF